MDDNKPTNLSEEDLHSMRYYIEYSYIPMLVDAVEQNPQIVDILQDTAFWRKHITQDNEGFTFEWDQLKCDPFRVDDNHLLFVYFFPEPKQVPDAACGAVLYDTANNKGHYYTLEATCDGGFMVCGTDTEAHHNYGAFETPTPNAFLDWVIKRHIPNYQD